MKTFFPAMTVAIGVLFGATLTASGQEIPKAVIAVIDSQHIQRTTLAGKDIQVQIDALRAKFQDEMQKVENGLRTEGDELKRQQAILAPEAFQAKGQAYQQKVKAAQRLAQEKRRQLELALRQAMNQLQHALIPVLQGIMDKRKITLIVDKSQVVLQASGLDVTTEVIEELDRRLPSVKVKLPTAQ